MKFTLEIELGDSMQDAEDVAASLRRVAKSLLHLGFDAPYCGVPDENGYSVGKWSVSE